MQIQPNSITKSTHGETGFHNTAGVGQGITYQDCYEFCEETKHLTTIKQASRDRHVCKKHACFLLPTGNTNPTQDNSKQGECEMTDNVKKENLFPTIELEGTGQYFDWKCDFCGEWTDDGMRSQITVPDMEGEDGQAEIEGRRFGYDICKTCLDAGADGVVERTIKHAERLEDQAKALREGLTLFAKNVKEWKTGADYQRVSDEFEAELEKMMKGEWKPSEEASTEVSEDGISDFMRDDDDDVPGFMVDEEGG